MIFVLNRLQSLLDEKSSEITGVISTPQSDRSNPVDGSSNDYYGYDQFMYANTHPTVSTHASTYSEDESEDELPVDSADNLGYANDPLGDDATGLLLGESTGYYETFLQQAQDSSTSFNSSSSDSLFAEIDSMDRLDALCKMPPGANICAKVHSTTSNQPVAKKQDPDPIITNSYRHTSTGDVEKWQAFCEASRRKAQTESRQTNSDKEADKWQNLYEESVREMQRMQNSYHELNERYRIVLRRSKEQTKLLALQNMRIISHGNEHQQILRRMRTLETSLEEADRRYQVERALRSAETVQCEQLSQALNESVREVKSLTTQQSSSVRELQQKEWMRTEYMVRTRESKQDKQRVEVERDNALIIIEILKQEKVIN